MNRSLCLLLAPCAFAVIAASAVAAPESGQVDFAKLTGPQHGQHVEVTLGKGLLKLASLIAKGHHPEASDLIAGLSRVRVSVVGLDDSNRAATTARLQALREDLGRQGWDQIVMVRGKHEEDVAVFLKQRDGEVIDGIVVTVIDERKNEAVFVNVVGRIRPEQIATLGQHLNLKQLQLAGKTRRI